MRPNPSFHRIASGGGRTQTQGRTGRNRGQTPVSRDADLRTLADKSPANMAFDGNGDYVYLAPNRVNLQMAQERFPDIKFLETREIY